MALSCNFCKETQPILFAFQGGVKVPFCGNDSSRFYDENTVEKSSSFPIAAFGFMEKPEDYGLFQERGSRMKQAKAWLSDLILAEKSQWEFAREKLITLHHDVRDEVERGFERVLARLDKAHSDFEAAMQTTEELLEKFKLEKDIKTTAIASLVLTAIDEGKSEARFYSGPARTTVNAVKRDVEGSLIVKAEDIEEFLLAALNMSHSEYAKKLPSKPEAQPALRIELTAFKKPSGAHSPIPPIRCGVCGVELTESNSMKCTDHEQCFFCFRCLESLMSHKMLCPCCKRGFRRTDRSYLKQKCIEIRSSKNRVTCFNCGKLMKEGAHVCKDNVQICLICVQERIAMNEMERRTARCPNCNEKFDELAFEEFEREEQHCYFCEKTMTLTDVRHVCGKNRKLECKECVESNRKGNNCGRCGKDLRPKVEWGR